MECGEAKSRIGEMMPEHELDLAKPENAAFHETSAAITARTLRLAEPPPTVERAARETPAFATS